MAELVLDCRATLGESLLYAPQEARLYFADIKAPLLQALNLENGELRKWPLPADLGGFALDGEGRALVALRTGLYWLSLSGGELELCAPAPFDPALIRFNESGCDSAGRFWIGCMTDPLVDAKTDPLRAAESEQKGGLFSFTTREGLRAHPDFAYITNGMAWSADERVFFIAHSQERKVYRYDYDAAQGRLGARNDFVTLGAQQQGMPDGAALDAEGYYWCAIYGAGVLHCYTPAGALEEVVRLPVSRPTKCCFAGAELEYLYIASSREGLDEAALREEPRAGGIFRIRPARPGLARHWRVA